jgi:hypothetical protein
MTPLGPNLWRRYLTTTQAARKYSICQGTIQAWAIKGLLVAQKVEGNPAYWLLEPNSLEVRARQWRDRRNARQRAARVAKPVHTAPPEEATPVPVADPIREVMAAPGASLTASDQLELARRRGLFAARSTRAAA